MKIIVAVYSFILLILQTSITGRAVYFSDGDTFTVITLTGHKMKVRVEGIDAPETVQEFGLEAKEFAMNEILGKMVRLQIINTDRYGRKVAKVFYDKEKDLGKELLNNGYAWHYKAYNKEQELALLELKARKEKRGLWAKPNPVPPWEFRKFGTNEDFQINGSNSSDDSGEMVWVCNSSSSYAYHKFSCTGLKQCKTGTTRTSLEKARKAGRKPCGFCWR